jgi:hypothetical protein
MKVGKRSVAVFSLLALSKAKLSIWGSRNLIIRPMSSYIDMRHNLYDHSCTVGTFSIHKTRYVLFASVGRRIMQGKEANLHQHAFPNRSVRYEVPPLTTSLLLRVW